MRLYLSSFDIGNRPDALVALAGTGRRVAVVVNALDNRTDARADWLKMQTEALVCLGFDAVALDLRDYFDRSDNLARRLRDVDVVWITGGNAFILRRAMKKSGFDGIIRRMIDGDEIVYAGFSAATVVAAPTLHGLQLVDDPHAVPAGYDADVVWQGLGLVPFAIAVHFRSSHAESTSVDRQIAFYETNGVSYKTLRDGEALVIRSDRQDIVG